MYRYLGPVLLSLSLAVSSFGQTPTPNIPRGGPAEPPKEPESLSTAQFLQDAAVAGMAEVELGQLALQKGQDPAVKSFARMMVSDHTQANTDLAALAAKKEVPLPKMLGADEKKAVQELSRQAGAAFDSSYATQMVRDHEKAVEMFRKASSRASVDAEVRAFAAKTLPTLEHHKKEADGLNPKLGAPQRAD